MAAKPGDKVNYRSFAGDVYEAVVKQPRGEDRVDIVVAIPGGEGYELHAIRWSETEPERNGAWPKGTTCHHEEHDGRKDED